MAVYVRAELALYVCAELAVCVWSLVRDTMCAPAGNHVVRYTCGFPMLRGLCKHSPFANPAVLSTVWKIPSCLCGELDFG